MPPVLLRSTTHGIKVIGIRSNTYIVVKQPAEYLPCVGTLLDDCYSFVIDDKETVKDYIHVIEKLHKEASIIKEITESVLLS